MATLTIDDKIDDLMQQIESTAVRHKIIEIMTNGASKVVFTGLSAFDYLRDNGWVEDSEKERPKQFYLCSICTDHSCGCLRDEKAFKNKHFGAAFQEGGSAFFDKGEILHALEVAVDFINNVLIDMFDKGYIKDDE